MLWEGMAMTRELYLVRHGRTMFNEKAVIQGWCDSPLTDEGIEMAERVGRYLRQEGITFDHAYTSTLTRTQQTLECIVNMPYERIEDLREWGFGAFEGERASLMLDYPWRDFFLPFGGEAQMDVRRRVVRALIEVMERPGHERVLAVSHGAACREFLISCAPDAGYSEGDVPGNCSIMRFTFENRTFALEEVLEQSDLKRILGE